MFNFKKIASVLASVVMLSSTIGFAAAAKYPEPFVKGGTADSAVIWGANAAMTDLTAAIDLQQSLGALVKTGTTTTGAGIVGEAAPLFTGGTKLYINDSLNSIKSVVTKADLPQILKAGSFSGNVDASTSFTIDIGSNPKTTFAKQPTSSNDPVYALTTSTTQANYIYNSTVTFSKAVNFSHADSEGQDIKLFGVGYTVAAATDTDTLVLLKSAEKFSLDSNNPTKDVTIEGSSYTIELVSASDSAATVKVTNSAGVSNSKEISESASKRVGDITIAVITADETNLKLSATIVAGTDKITLEDGSAVQTGETDTTVDGTLVDFETGNPNNLTALTISVYAPESDKDAINAGSSFVDPIYKNFKLDFSGINIASDSTTARETITIIPKSDDKSDITFTDWRGNTKTIQWSKDIAGNLVGGVTSSVALMLDDNNRNITVVEMGNITHNGYVVVGNQDDGRLLKLTAVKNSSQTGSTNTDGDKVEFTDVFSNDVYKAIWSSDGVGSIAVGGKTYDLYLTGDANNASENYQVHLNYPDSSGAGDLILFPTIQTGKGAKIAFYEPVELQLNGYAMRAGSAVVQNITRIRIPDGDGYEDATITPDSLGGVTANMSLWNITRDGSTVTLNVSNDGIDSGVLWNVEGLTFNITSHNITTENGYNKTVVYLVEPDGGGNINGSALIVWEEKDDNTNWNAVIIATEPGRTGDDGLGVDETPSGDTWSNDSSSWRSSRASDSKLTDAADLWGTIVTYDASDSDQTKATISYPDEQIFAQIYMAENSASITPGSVSGGGGGQILIVKDSEVSSVAGKNLVVVGGSCINTVAAKILGSDSPLCTSDFTAKTNTGEGQYIIKSVKSPYSDNKVAMLVAGYEAADTVNAVKKVMEGVDSDAGTEQVYPIASA